MEIPYWALGLIYWVHMVATVVWVGGLATLVILVVPAARRTLEPMAYAAFLANLQKRMDPLGWTCLGMHRPVQMSAIPISGFLASKPLGNRYSAEAPGLSG
jgi:uncharacterized membrane protein